MLIGIYGNYGAGNAGDELVGQGIIRIVEECSENIEEKHKCILFARDTDRARRWSKQVAVFRVLPSGLRSIFSSWIGSISIIYACDIIIFGGGTLFTDKPRKSRWLWLWHLTLLHIMNKNIIIIGQGFGPFHDDAKSLVKKIKSYTNGMTVRDNESYQLVKDEYPSAILASDPIFVGQPEESISLADDTLNCVISLRSWQDDDEMARKTAKVMNDLAKKYNGKVRFVALPMQNIYSNDYIILKNMERYLSPDIEVYMPDPDTFDAETVVETIRRADFVLGMRLHASLLAILYRKPFLAIDYMGKTRANMDSLGLADRVLSLEKWHSLSSEEIANRIISQINTDTPDLALWKAYFHGRILAYPHSLVVQDALDKVINKIKQ